MDRNLLKKFAISSKQELVEKINSKIKTFYVNEDFELNRSGDVYILTNEKHTLSLSKKEYQNREILINRIKDITLEQVIEESAYTWFNRIIAIRYMEIHDYLPLSKSNTSLGFRVLSSRDNAPDPEIMKITNLLNPDLDIEFDKLFYSNIKDNNKRFEYILLLICQKLAKVIPEVFGGATDYIDLLIPDNLLNESGYISKLLRNVPEDNFNEVDILGWLYQYWNTETFEKIYDGDMSNRKIAAKDIPAATQLFTPDWVVQYMVENSLGKFWLEHCNNTTIKQNFKYYINIETSKKADFISPEKIKFLDPCSGSGHILLYAFELFYNIYISLGYDKSSISELILKNNLYGIDIDDRAKQLSILSLILKAREYDKNIFNNSILNNLQIISMPETINLNLTNLDLLIDNKADEDNINYILDSFKSAKEIGSLLKLKQIEVNAFIQKIKVLEKKDLSIFEIEKLKIIKQKFLPILKAIQIINQKYEIVVTNPPYMNSSKMTSNLLKYCSQNYAMGKNDLATSFILKIYQDYLAENGYAGMVTTLSWMYIKSFEKLRNHILNTYQIDGLVDYGTELFEGKIGHLPIVSWVVEKTAPYKDVKVINLEEFCFSKRELKKTEFFNAKNQYIFNQQDIQVIPGAPLAYTASKTLLKVFETNTNLGTDSIVRNGMKTGDNGRFLRNWWEVDVDKICFDCKSYKDSLNIKKKWFPYNKGGEYRKWYGNEDTIVNWLNQGNEIFNNAKQDKRNVQNYPNEMKFSPVVSWSLINLKPAFRLKTNCLSDIAGMFIYQKDYKKSLYILAFCNSVISYKILKMTSKTLNFQAGDIAKLPIYYSNIDYIAKICEENINLEKNEWDLYETSKDFKRNPLIKTGSIKKTIEEHLQYLNNEFSKLKSNEIAINKHFIELYGLTNEQQEDVADSDITYRIPDAKTLVINLISYFVGCLFGRYSLDEEGLICANLEFKPNKYKSFIPTQDNIIPIIENDCFANDIIIKFEQFLETVYGKKTLYENLEFIAETLGKRNGENAEETIRRYFISDFYNDHLKLYQKRPIYWLFDSGKQNGFKCLIYMHRYNSSTISKIRLDYLHKIQNEYEKKLKDINENLTGDISLQDKKYLTKAQSSISAKLQETNEYEEKIAHLADKRITIDLDDGVIINYEKFHVTSPKTGQNESILANTKSIVKTNKKEE